MGRHVVTGRQVMKVKLVHYLIGANTKLNAVKRAHVLHLELFQQSQGAGAGENLKIVGHKILGTTLHVTLSVPVGCARRRVTPIINHLALRGHLLVVPRALGSVSAFVLVDVQAFGFAQKQLKRNITVGHGILSLHLFYLPSQVFFTLKMMNLKKVCATSVTVPWRDKGAVRTGTAGEVALRVAGLQVTLSGKSQLTLCGQISQPIHWLQLREHFLAGTECFLSFKSLDALEHIRNAAHCLWGHHCICTTTRTLQEY